MKTKLRCLLNKKLWAYGLFWSWNLIFLAFMLFGFAPTVLPELLTAVKANEIPAIFMLYGTTITLIPVMAVIIGGTLLRREPERLFAFGYGVEGPLMVVLVVRFFAIRQATTAVSLLLIVAALGIITYLWQLLDKKIDQRSPLLAHVRLIGLTMLLLIGLYVSIWIAFYAFPLGFGFLRSIGEILTNMWDAIIHFRWADIEWRFVPFAVLGGTLMVYTGTLFVLMPIAISILYAKAWLASVRAIVAAYSRPRVAALSTAVILLIVVLFIQSNRQPQQSAFALLETVPADIDAAQTLLDQEEKLRDGLLNAYLAPQRYLSSVGEVRHITELYEEMLDMDEESAEKVQEAYEVVAAPVLYQPVNPIPDNKWRWENQALRNEPADAAELYQQFFDEPIYKGEQEIVIDAARNTWDPVQARAAWQAVDDREIQLLRQELTITEHRDWAEMELHEVYHNVTGQRQEVVYYFSLPETAVITGLWLGNSDNLEERFEYQVAPRGAAQAVYQNEVRRRVDPALIEQIGPSQYRLRAFPVEPLQQNWDNDRFNRLSLEDGPPLHLWLTWQTMAADNEWPLPYLAEKANVFWTDETVRLINGKPMEADNETWLPERVTPSARTTIAEAHQVNFANGQSVVIRPLHSIEPPTPSGDLHLAVVLDRSRSMGKLSDGVATALDELAEWGTADVYLTASEFRGEAASRTTLDELNVDDILYYGGQNPAQLLTQFGELQNGENYDAIFVLTDGSGYELGEAQTAVSIPDAPIWMVHLNGRFPIGYDDDTLAAIQASGGGSVGNIADGMSRLHAGDAADWVDGYEWRVLDEQSTPAANVELHNADDPFVAFAARQIILAEMAAQRGNLSELETLDQLHAIAIENSIVTPYSSMIVLVTERQEELLEELEGEDDRFEREFEEIGETQPPVTVTGVPEPEEWLLIILGVLMLGWYWWGNGLH